VIAVTCRNGETFTIDPATIERAESVPDTVLHMVGGRTYVLAMSMDELVRAIRDSHAELVVAQRQMGDTTAELADSASSAHAAANLRVERRALHRDGDAPGSPADRRPSDERPTPDA
jgi:flagellar protein FlbD